MTGFDNTVLHVPKGKDAAVSVLDESLFTGDKVLYNLFFTVDPEFISVAVFDREKNRFTGFEGFHFAKPLGDEQLVQKVEGITWQSTILQKIEFVKSSVLVSGNRFTLVPSALFKPEDAREFFSFNNALRDGDEVQFDLIRGYDAVNIFSVSSTLKAGLKKIFEEFTVHHRMTATLEATRRHAGNKPSKNLFLHIHSSTIEAIVTEERKLIFANSFPYKVAEDGIYFVMMVCDQLSLNPESVEVLIAGEIEKEDAFFKQLQQYISNISFAGRNKTATFTYGFDSLPAHFYHGAFSQILCES